MKLRVIQSKRLHLQKDTAEQHLLVIPLKLNSLNESTSQHLSQILLTHLCMVVRIL